MPPQHQKMSQFGISDTMIFAKIYSNLCSNNFDVAIQVTLTTLSKVPIVASGANANNREHKMLLIHLDATPAPKDEPIWNIWYYEN